MPELVSTKFSDIFKQEYEEPKNEKVDLTSQHFLNGEEISGLAIMQNAKNNGAREEEYAKLQNAKVFSDLYNLSSEDALRLEPQLRNAFYSTQDFTSLKMHENLKVIYDQAAIQNEIGMTRYKQTISNNRNLEDQIAILKASAPRESELDKIMEKMSNSDDFAGKVKDFLRSAPYMAASQLPNLIGSSVYGAGVAGLSAIAGTSLFGVGAAPSAVAGYAIGSAAYSYRVETGLAADKMMEEAKNQGVDLRPVDVSTASHLTGAFIAALDTASFLVGAKAAMAPASSVIKSATKNALKAQVKTGAMLTLASKSVEIAGAAGVEGLTEGMQEAIGDVLMNTSFRSHNLITGDHLVDKKWQDILKDAAVVATLAIPMTITSAGLGASVTGLARKARLQAKVKAEKIVKTHYNGNSETINSQYSTNEDNAGMVAENDIAALIKEDKLQRPIGTYFQTAQVEAFSNDQRIVVNLNQEEDGVSFASMDGQVKGKVIQNPGAGLEVIFESESGASIGTIMTLESKMREIVHEGRIYGDLNIDQDTQNFLNQVNEYEELMAKGLALNELDNTGLRFLVKDLADKLDYHEKGSPEHQAIMQGIYNYTEMETKYSNMATQSGSIKNRIEAQIFNNAVPSILREKMHEVLLQAEARLPFSNKQQESILNIKERGKAITEKEFDLIKRAEDLKPLDALSVDVLARISNKLSDMTFDANIILETNNRTFTEKLAIVKKELEGTIIDEGKDPYSLEREVEKGKLANTLKNVLVRDQRQYHWIIAAIAGEESELYDILYRDLASDERKIRAKTQEITEGFIEKVRLGGATPKEVSAWSKEYYTIEGIKGSNGKDFRISTGEALSISMHMKADKNRKAIMEKGFVKKDRNGNSIITKNEKLMKAIDQKIQKDRVAMAVARAMKPAFAEVGALVKSTNDSLTGTKLFLGENYFPIETMEDVYLDVDRSVKREDADGKFLTYARGFLAGRTDEIHPVVLSDAYETFSRSVDSGVKYALGERSLWNASRMLYDTDVATMIKKESSEENYKLIEKHLAHFAGERNSMSNASKIMEMARRAQVKAVVAFNPFIAAKAPISWMYGARFVQPKHMLKSALSASKYGKKFQMEMANKFPAIKERMNKGSSSSIQEVMDKSKVKRLKQGSVSYEGLAFAMITKADLSTVCLIADAAYNQCLEEIEMGKLSPEVKKSTGMSNIDADMSIEYKHAAAVVFAEDVINKTQPAISELNKSMMQKGGAIERTFSTFGGFTNITHNFIDQAVLSIKEEGKGAIPVVAKTLALFALQAAAAGGVDTVKDLLLQREREERSNWKYVADAVFGNTFYVRDLYGILKSKDMYGAYSGGKDGSLAFDRLLMMYGTAGIYLAEGSGLSGGEIDKRKMVQGTEALVEAVALTCGAPMSAKYLIEVIGK